ncbi:MAG: hypothetical protein WC661_01835 [Opitutaceae bacterium]
MFDPALRVSSKEVLWHFIADFYDGPIAGLAVFKDEILQFCCLPEEIPHQHIYALHRLSDAELAEELRVKAQFESLVGTHWSFDLDGKPLPRIDYPTEIARVFYEEEGMRQSPHPRDKPIVAWFDVTKE